MGYGFNGFFVIILRSLVVLFKLFVAKLSKMFILQRFRELFVEDKAKIKLNWQGMLCRWHRWRTRVQNSNKSVEKDSKEFEKF